MRRSQEKVWGTPKLASQFVSAPAGESRQRGLGRTPMDFMNQEPGSWTIKKNMTLGSRETFSPGNQVPARPGHWAGSVLEGPGPRAWSGAGYERRAWPRKMS